MSDNTQNTVLVLDLDDTLYKEVTYLESGVASVCSYVNNLYQKSIKTADILLLKEQKKDWLANLCETLNLPISAKESILWIYRLHQPTIHLDKKTQLSIEKLSSIAKLVILTDGRSITQRQKIHALGLSHLPVYISEEYQSEKPDSLRFKQIMNDIPSKKYIYVGDNPKKDFIAPNQLNWNTVGLKGDIFNIHPQCIDVTKDAKPKHWISHLEELISLV